MSDQADHHTAIALAHVHAQRWADAEAEAKAALALRPDHLDATHLLGVIAWRTGRLEDAARLIAATVARAPNYAEAHKNLGVVLERLGRTDQAIACFRRATELQPTLTEAHFHLATLMREHGNLDGAIAIYRRVIALDPGHAEAHNDLGAALKEKGQLADAIESFRRALAINPDHVAALVNCAGALTERGEPDAARAMYGRARDLAPERADARFGYCLSFVPIAYADEARMRDSRALYRAELAALRAHYAGAPDKLAAAAASAGEQLPFYLAYQAENDRELQQMFGGLLAEVMAAGYPAFSRPPPMPPRGAGERIRVGVVSGFFRNHSVWKLFGGWVREMDRTRFELFGYSTAPRADSETPAAQVAFDSFVESSASFGDLAATIAAHRLHVLLFPEIGMDPATARLAALRLAPVQAMAWGHPDTSGLPTIDYFLSSELMEPPDGDAAYSERLVRLPNLSIHYAPPPVVPVAPNLAELAVRPDAVKYLCCQSLYKYLPRHDDVFARIAAAVPRAQFIFIRHPASPAVSDLTLSRVAEALAGAGLDPARHLVFAPPQDSPRYAGLNAACDVYLDSLEWSGGNTTLEAAAAGLPIVTLPGRLMRGRHSAAILTMMGISETIARDKDDYVALAVRLGTDESWRDSIAANVAAQRHRLYRDPAPVRALENLIESWIAGRG